MAPPEPVEWQDFGGFRYETVDRGGQRSDLDIAEFLDAFTERYEEDLELTDLRRRRVVLLATRLWNTANGRPRVKSCSHTLYIRLASGDRRVTQFGNA
jgi:hypothetical protein